MGDFLGNIGRKMLKVVKRMLKHAVMATAPIWGTILIILLILAALTYENTMQEGTKQEGSWQSTPYVATQYSANIEIKEDGTIVSEITPKELWDEMIKRDNTIDSYLDKPEEFAKLLHAELVTSFPDTRPDPSEEINWEEILDPKSDKIQGIIKFKRERNNQEPIDLVYVDDGTFMDWVEQYNLTQDEAIREKLLTHFTIGSTTVNTQNSNQNVSLNYQEGDVWTDISEAIVRSALTTPSRGSGLCQSWVYHVYVNAGLPEAGFIGAYQAFQANCVSTDRNNIPIGACVYATGSQTLGDGSPNIYGHVGIYVGDIDGDGEGDVMDEIGGIRTISLSEWIAEAERQGNTNCGGTPGYLGWGWQSGSPSRFLTEEEIEKIDITSEATVVVGEGNGENTTSTTQYYVIVASWKDTTETRTVNGNVVSSSKSGSITLQNINYQDYVKQFTLPFDYLWALTVTGRDRFFTLDLADMAFNSKIEITIHDNLTTTTESDTVTSKRVVYDESTDTSTIVTTVTEYETIDRTNTLNIGLTLADVWIVNYSQEYDYKGPTVITESTETSSIPGDTPQTTGSKVHYYKVETQEYISKPANVIPKVEKGKDNHNFVTLFLDDDHYSARSNIISAPDWLFNILERNESTSEMVDLTKYLLYKATGHSYGVTDFNFETFSTSEFSSISVSGGAGVEFTKAWENLALWNYRNGRGGYNGIYVTSCITSDNKYYIMHDDIGTGYGNRNYGFGVCFYVGSSGSFQNTSYFEAEGINITDPIYQNYGSSKVEVEIVDRISAKIWNEKRQEVINTVNRMGAKLEDYQIDCLTDMRYQGWYITDTIEAFMQYGLDENRIRSASSGFSGNRGDARWTLFSTGKYTTADGQTIQGSSSSSNNNEAQED